MRWTVAIGQQLLDRPGVLDFEVTIQATAPTGEMAPHTYLLSFEQYRHMQDLPEGSLHGVTEAINELRKKLG